MRPESEEDVTSNAICLHPFNAKHLSKFLNRSRMRKIAEKLNWYIKICFRLKLQLACFVDLQKFRKIHMYLQNIKKTCADTAENKSNVAKNVDTESAKCCQNFVTPCACEGKLGIKTPGLRSRRFQSHSEETSGDCENVAQSMPISRSRCRPLRMSAARWP